MVPDKSPDAHPTTVPEPLTRKTEMERIGVLLVHGIGDQNRFEHLHAVAQRLVTTTSQMYGNSNVSVQMLPGIANRSDLSIIIKCSPEHFKVLDLREMWWRDLGEKATPFSIARFWAWAATFFGTRGRFYYGPCATQPPKNSATAHNRIRLLDRFSLFFKITYFFILLLPLRLSILLVNLIPGIRPINLFRTIFTYMSSVKMYQQRRGKVGGTIEDSINLTASASNDALQIRL